MNGMTEVYNFTTKFEEMAVAKEQGYIFQGLNKNDFTIFDKTFSDYKTLCDQLHKVIYEGKKGESQLKAISEFLGVSVDFKAVLKALCPTKVSINRINRNSAIYPEYKRLQEQLKQENAKEVPDINIITDLQTKIKVLRNSEQLFTQKAFYQVSNTTFRRNLEIAIAQNLANKDFKADFETIEEKMLASKGWQEWTTKATQNGIKCEPYIKQMDLKGLKAKTREVYKFLSLGLSQKDSITTNCNIQLGTALNNYDIVVELYKADKDIMTKIYGYGLVQFTKEYKKLI